MTDPRDGDRRPRRWWVDGNNVFGSRPDGWWNDRPAAMQRFTQCLALWCRTHADPVTVVFDRPVPDPVMQLAGGNLSVVAAARSGRNAADDTIAALVADRLGPAGADVDTADVAPADVAPADVAPVDDVVVTSDRGLRQRLPSAVEVWGVGRFRDLIGY